MDGQKTVSGAYKYSHLSSQMRECPFCGCSDVYIFTSPDKSTAWGHCGVCASRGPYVVVVSSRFEGSLLDAVREWNNRGGHK